MNCAHDENSVRNVEQFERSSTSKEVAAATFGQLSVALVAILSKQATNWVSIRTELKGETDRRGGDSWLCMTPKEQPEYMR